MLIDAQDSTFSIPGMVPVSVRRHKWMENKFTQFYLHSWDPREMWTCLFSTFSLFGPADVLWKMGTTLRQGILLFVWTSQAQFRYHTERPTGQNNTNLDVLVVFVLLTQTTLLWFQGIPAFWIFHFVFKHSFCNRTKMRACAGSVTRFAHNRIFMSISQLPSNLPSCYDSRLASLQYELVPADSLSVVPASELQLLLQHYRSVPLFAVTKVSTVIRFTAGETAFLLPKHTDGSCCQFPLVRAPVIWNQYCCSTFADDTTFRNYDAFIFCRLKTEINGVQGAFCLAVGHKTASFAQRAYLSSTSWKQETVTLDENPCVPALQLNVGVSKGYMQCIAARAFPRCWSSNVFQVPHRDWEATYWWASDSIVTCSCSSQPCRRVPLNGLTGGEMVVLVAGIRRIPWRLQQQGAAFLQSLQCHHNKSTTILTTGRARQLRQDDR